MLVVMRNGGTLGTERRHLNTIQDLAEVVRVRERPCAPGTSRTSPFAASARLPELSGRQRNGVAMRPSKRDFVVHVAALAGAGHGRLLLAARRAGRAELAATVLTAAQFTAATRPVEHGEL